MQHFKALKETTFGTRLVRPGEVVAMQLDDGQTPAVDIWQAVSGAPSSPCGLAQGMDSGAPAITADMPSAMFMQHSLAAYERQQQEMAEMCAKLAALPALEQEKAMLEKGNDSLMAQLTTTKNSSDALQSQVDSYAAKLTEAERALKESRSDTAALHEERQAMQAEHVELMEKMQAEITSLKAEITNLKKKK